MKFEDTNFLGLGKELSLERSSNVDRTAWELGYVDPNVLGSWWRLSAGYSSLSDGSEKRLSIDRPFYALDTRWSAGISAADGLSDVSRYSLGHVVERLQMQERKFEIGGGISEGLHDGWTTRYLGGFRYDAREFQPRVDEPLAAIPADRVVAYPWVGLEVLEDQYVSTRNLDQIGRTEDLYLGLSARLEAGFAAQALGSTRNGAILNGKLQAGADLGNEQYLIHTLGYRDARRGRPARERRAHLGQPLLLAAVRASRVLRLRQRHSHVAPRPGSTTAARRRQRPAWLPPALPGWRRKRAGHARAAVLHRLAAAEALQRRRRGVLRRRPLLGPRRVRRCARGLAEGRRSSGCASAARAPASATSCTSTSRSRWIAPATSTACSCSSKRGGRSERQPVSALLVVAPAGAAWRLRRARHALRDDAARRDYRARLLLRRRARAMDRRRQLGGERVAAHRRSLGDSRSGGARAGLLDRDLRRSATGARCGGRPRSSRSRPCCRSASSACSRR